MRKATITKTLLVGSLLSTSVYALDPNANKNTRDQDAKERQASSVEEKADSRENQQKANEYAADNTGRNARDRNDSALTADQQGFGAKDTQLAAKIRKALTDDDSLSTQAQNIKVIVRDAKVTLKGPVKSAQEKQNVQQKAVALAGAQNVRNEIDVDMEKAESDRDNNEKRTQSDTTDDQER